ncbi:hypothetical protein HD553DRAFT_321026 [Filobasidium floriforme]|uniref:uncharacterized protein n=1 Tax=Filobasidium floriforme TaxID=5210 RepID=UPI001E8DC2B7|nr:uncharacterized protein HD553DRAFT_321026 [Filobasidium floriforme]KAH8090297.1 hypothetical protein HD553DRAFT_321026 [Filobasidium floriforme]
MYIKTIVFEMVHVVSDGNDESAPVIRGLTDLKRKKRSDHKSARGSVEAASFYVEMKRSESDPAVSKGGEPIERKANREPTLEPSCCGSELDIPQYPTVYVHLERNRDASPEEQNARGARSNDESEIGVGITMNDSVLDLSKTDTSRTSPVGYTHSSFLCRANIFWHRRGAELAKRMNIEHSLPDGRVEPYIPQTQSEQVSWSRSLPGLACACTCRTSGHIAITESRRRSRGMKAEAKAESRIKEDSMPATLNFDYHAYKDNLISRSVAHIASCQTTVKLEESQGFMSLLDSDRPGHSNSTD